MNQRNLEYIYPSNNRVDFPIADDKLLTKKYLLKAGVPHPETYQVYGYFFDLRNLDLDLSERSDFVIKPARGSGGGGIIVIVRKENGYWYSVGGKQYSLEDLRRHMCDIIFGIYSFGIRDEVVIEQRIIQHDSVNEITEGGLADVRLIVYQHQPIMAMMRLPTSASDGKANLHQGAIGVGVDIDSGITIHATHEGSYLDAHPDSNVFLIGRKIVYWSDIIKIGIQISNLVPLKYLGVDIAVSHEGPKVLEINVRPGIEIQNVNGKGMRRILAATRQMQLDVTKGA
ncbi:MAG: hypothetical protein OEM38_09385 [Gammaproteobacteria bacterium]|nr:hypothetical protein [Gammaproteobacteria bacterium]